MNAVSVSEISMYVYIIIYMLDDMVTGLQDIHWVERIIIREYRAHLRTKWNSSSISFNGHLVHFRRS